MTRDVTAPRRVTDPDSQIKTSFHTIAFTVLFFIFF